MSAVLPQWLRVYDKPSAGYVLTSTLVQSPRRGRGSWTLEDATAEYEREWAPPVVSPTARRGPADSGSLVQVRDERGNPYRVYLNSRIGAGVNARAVPDTDELRFVVEWLLEEQRRRGDFAQTVLDLFDVIRERSNLGNHRDAMIGGPALMERVGRSLRTVRAGLAWLQANLIIKLTSRGGKRPGAARGVANVYQLLRSAAHDRIRRAYRDRKTRQRLVNQPVDKGRTVPLKNHFLEISSVLETVNPSGVRDKVRPRKALKRRVSPELFEFASEYRDRIPRLRTLSVRTIARVLADLHVKPSAWSSVSHFIRAVDLEAKRHQMFLAEQPQSTVGAWRWFLVMNLPVPGEETHPTHAGNLRNAPLSAPTWEDLAHDVRVARRVGLVAADWPETQPLPDGARSALADYRRAQLKTNQ